jgi:hypothetical protein
MPVTTYNNGIWNSGGPTNTRAACRAVMIDGSGLPIFHLGDPTGAPRGVWTDKLPRGEYFSWGVRTIGPAASQ